MAIGADIGWMTGGIRGATTEGMTFWDGAWRGGLVGAVGGGLSMIGGAGMPFITNLALGTGSGALTGGLDAALWGNDIGKGMLWGAAAGAAFTTFTSENFKNMLKGEKFLTNENVFNNMMDRGAGKQEILSHFKFEGTHIDEEGLSSFWYDRNDLSQFGIRYRNGSFDSYEALYGSYLKESYHLNKFAKNGLAGLDLGNTGSMGLDRWPEERLGAIQLYKNKGLIGGDVQYINAIRTSESWINSLNQFGDYIPMYSYNPFKTRWWHRVVFNIPRRW